MRKHRVQLGLGLISIGRTWGARPVPVPGEAEALAFLEGAYELGIRLFDTSPSYGDSEVKLGRFLTGLSREERTVHRPLLRRTAPQPDAEHEPARRD